MRYADRILAIRDARMLRNRKRFISVRNAWKESIRATDSMRAEKLFKGKNNLAICMDAFGIVSSEAGKMKGQVNAITNKYNMNRAQRRQEGKKNKHGKNGAVVTPIGNASGRDNS